MDIRLVKNKIKIDNYRCKYILECLYCHKSFELNGGVFNNNQGKFCCHKCSSEFLKGKPRSVKVTWGDKISKSRKGKFCGKNHPMWGKKRPDLAKYNRRFKPLQIGHLNPNWKGGITIKVQSIKSSKRWKQWRSDVFKKDSWTCQICGQKGGDLEAHHWIFKVCELINTSAEELIYYTDNGITLCIKCHRTY